MPLLLDRSALLEHLFDVCAHPFLAGGTDEVAQELEQLGSALDTEIQGPILPIPLKEVNGPIQPRACTSPKTSYSSAFDFARSHKVVFLGL